MGSCKADGGRAGSPKGARPATPDRAPGNRAVPDSAPPGFSVLPTPSPRLRPAADFLMTGDSIPGTGHLGIGQIPATPDAWGLVSAESPCGHLQAAPNALLAWNTCVPPLSDLLPDWDAELNRRDISESPTPLDAPARESFASPQLERELAQDKEVMASNSMTASILSLTAALQSSWGAQEKDAREEPMGTVSQQNHAAAHGARDSGLGHGPSREWPRENIVSARLECKFAQDKQVMGAGTALILASTAELKSSRGAQDKDACQEPMRNTPQKDHAAAHGAQGARLLHGPDAAHRHASNSEAQPINLSAALGIDMIQKPRPNIFGKLRQGSLAACPAISTARHANQSAALGNDALQEAMCTSFQETRAVAGLEAASAACAAMQPSNLNDMHRQPTSACLRLRGLPFGTTKEQLRCFFEEHGVGKDVEPSDDALLFVYHKKIPERFLGQAVVRMLDMERARHAKAALNRQWIGQRYIEAFVCGDPDCPTLTRDGPCC